MPRIVVFMSILLAGSQVISSGEAYSEGWEESCRIHEVIEERQDAERRRTVEEATDPDLRKAALKDGERSRPELVWVRLEQANLIVYVSRP